MRLQSVDWLFITLLLLFAAGLRIIGISYGQPDPQYAPSTYPVNMLHKQTPIHPDEYFYVSTPFRMLVTGRLNPKFFENPSFLINLNYVTFALTDAAQGVDPANWEGASLREIAPFHLYVIGRLYSVLGGLLTVAATFAVARLLAGRWAAILAGGLVALSMPLVQHAHYSTTSSLATGFVTLCVWASVAAIKKSSTPQRFFWLAGVAAGLAAGNRYNASAVGILVFLTGLLLLYRQPTRHTLRMILIGWVAFPLVFLLTTPYAILDFSTFWEHFTFIFSRFAAAGDVVYPTPYGLFFEYRYIVLFGLGVPATLLALLGLWAAWNKHPAKQVFLKTDSLLLFLLLLAGFVVPYSLVVLRAVIPENGDQLTLPVIPVWAVVAGIGFSWLVQRSLWRFSGLLLFTGVMIVPLTLTMPFVIQLSGQDTREVAQAWIYEHIPLGSRLHLQGPYNVPLDAADYVTQISFTGEFDQQTLDQLRAGGFDYFVVSDAWSFFNQRMHEKLPESRLQQVDAAIAFEATLEPIYRVERPTWPGYDWITNNTTYWHNPSIRVYCLNESSCAAVGQADP